MFDDQLVGDTMDLSLISETALLKELEKRFDAFVFVGTQLLTTRNAAQGELGSASLTISGNPFTCAGLVHAACGVVESRALTIMIDASESEGNSEDNSSVS